LECEVERASEVRNQGPLGLKKAYGAPSGPKKSVFVLRGEPLFVGEAQKRGRPQKTQKQKTKHFFGGKRAKEEYVNEE
jgi:hypothetical protein